MIEYCDDTKRLMNELTKEAGKLIEYGLRLSCSKAVEIMYSYYGIKTNISYGQLDYEIEYDNEDLKKYDELFKTNPEKNHEIGFDRKLWEKLMNNDI